MCISGYVQLSAALMSIAPIGHSPRTGRNCRCVDGPLGHPPAWLAGTRASIFVSGRGYLEPSDCWKREKEDSGTSSFETRKHAQWLFGGHFEQVVTQK